MVDATSFGKSCTGHKEGAAGGSRDEAENKGQEAEGQDQKVMRSDVHSEGLRTSVVENWSIIYRYARFAWTRKKCPEVYLYLYTIYTRKYVHSRGHTPPHAHTCSHWHRRPCSLDEVNLNLKIEIDHILGNRHDGPI